MTNINTVYIQIDKWGEYYDKNAFNAQIGFNKRGISTEKLHYNDLECLLECSENDYYDDFLNEVMVVGGIEFIFYALTLFNIPTPENIDYPVELREFLCRDIKQGTLKDARKLNGPIFIKPVNIHKLFTGHVIREFKDLILSKNINENTQIWISDIIEINSEWRIFVNKSKIVGLSCYKGDCTIFPDISVAKQIIKKYETAPSAYVIDLGINKNGTFLIEINDGFAFGCYGLDSFWYVEMLMNRWKEIINV